MRSRLPIKLISKILLRTPDLLPFLVKGLHRKHIGADKDYKRADGIASKSPHQISLRITNACNHRCDVCGQYGENGYVLGEGGKHLLTSLPIETYMQLVDQVAANKPLFYVTGGEPFLYPGLVPLMNYIKSRGCYVSLVTNGVHLAKHAEEIVKNSWDMVLVSFDGPREVHDKCRNYNGAFDTAVAGLEEINKWKKKLGRVKPYLMTSTTISKKNAAVLNETFNIGKKINPDFMIVYLSWFTNEQIGKAHTEVMERELGITPYTWRSYVSSFTNEDTKIFAEAIKQIKNKKWPFNYVIVPDLKDNQLEKYYADPSELFEYNKCVAPFIMVDVMPNGDVVTCRDFIDVKVGNITEKPLLEIWNDTEFVKFRKLLIKRNGTLPQCSRCCGLMGF